MHEWADKVLSLYKYTTISMTITQARPRYAYTTRIAANIQGNSFTAHKVTLAMPASWIAYRQTRLSGRSRNQRVLGSNPVIGNFNLNNLFTAYCNRKTQPLIKVQAYY